MAVVVGLGVVGCDGLGEKKEKKARNNGKQICHFLGVGEHIKQILLLRTLSDPLIN